MTAGEPENGLEPSGCHIRLATWDDDPPAGGQGVYVRGLRSALTACGARASTVAGRGESPLSFRRLTGHGPLDMSISLNAAIHPLVAGDPDIVHVSGGPGGLQILRRIETPVVYTAHHTFEMSHPRYRPQRWYAAVEARSYKLAAALIAVSTSTADSLRRMGVPADKIAVVPPGIDLERFRLPADREGKRMLFVGRLEREKGPLDAVAAMEKVISEVPGVTGLVVGSGPLRKAVERRLGSVGGVRYSGRVSDEELADLYASADVVLMPSAFEGLGFVALEAMASGCVVVGYDVPGLRDSVGRRGILVPPGDVESLAAACKSLLTDTGRRQDIASAASAYVQEAHSWDRRAREVIDVYQQVLAGGGTRCRQ